MDREPLESRLAFSSLTFWLRHQIQSPKPKAQEKHQNTKRQQLSGRLLGGWEAPLLQDPSMGWRKPGMELPRCGIRNTLVPLTPALSPGERENRAPVIGGA